MNHTLVIQGRVLKETLEFYKEKYINFPVIISTWDDIELSEYELPKNFILIKNKKPKLVGKQNINLQVISTSAGLKRCTTKYATKIRGDEYYSNIEQIFDLVEKNENKFICSPIFFRRGEEWPLHPSDHVIGGTTENLINFFNLDVKNLPNEYSNCSPEQLLTMSYFDRLGINHNENRESLMINTFDLFDLDLQKPYRVVENGSCSVYYDTFYLNENSKNTIKNINDIKKKVAVCISGQSRTWDSCIDNIKTFFKNNDEFQFDFFIHTWDTSRWENQKMASRNDSRFLKEFKYKSNALEYVKAYKPKLYKIEKYEDYSNRKKIGNIPISDVDFGGVFTHALMYSFKQSIVLKKLWERQNNFKYDHVVKIRPDICFLNQDFKKHTEILKSNKDKENPFLTFFDFESNWQTKLVSTWGPDLYWIFPNSESADKYSEYFSKSLIFESENDVLFSHNRFCFENNITPISIESDSRYPIYIIRPYHIPFINTNGLDSQLLLIIDRVFTNSNDSRIISFLDIITEEDRLDDLDNYDIVSFFKRNRDVKKKLIEHFNKLYNHPSL